MKSRLEINIGAVHTNPKTHLLLRGIGFLLINLILFIKPGDVFADADSLKNHKIETKIILEYFDDNGNNYLKAKLSSSINGVEQNLSQMPLIFLNLQKEGMVEIGRGSCHADGIVVCQLEDNLEHIDINGNLVYICRFSGNELYAVAEKELIIKPLKISMSFQIMDKKVIVINALELNDSTKTYLSGTTVNFFTPTLFGDMPIGESTFVNEECVIDFPENLPGDAEGNMEIIALIIDDGVFGNLGIKGIKNWGKAFVPQKDQAHHKLWTTDPPVWMLITLITILGSVWFLYVIVFYKVWLMKKSGLKKED